VPLGLPFALMQDEQLAGAVFFGVSSALLAWTLRRRPYLLPLFASLTFVQNLGARQYAPLVMALATTGLPVIGLLIKPNLALPLFLTYRSHRLAWAIAIGVGVWSLLAFPGWPFTWLSQLHGYTGTLPILNPIGLLAFGLALLFRQPLIALYCLMPLRRLYDVLPMFLVLQDTRSTLALVIVSWLMLGLDSPELQIAAFSLTAVIVARWSQSRQTRLACEVENLMNEGA